MNLDIVEDVILRYYRQTPLSVEEVPEPIEILLIEGPIETELSIIGGHLGLGGIRAQRKPARIRGEDTGKVEDEQRKAD